MFNLTELTINHMAEGQMILVYPEMAQSYPERNAAPRSSACSISVYCKLSRLSYTCQKLSHRHLMKNVIYWLNESGCSNCTVGRHFPTTFWELRLRVISDVLVIARSPRA